MCNPMAPGISESSQTTRRTAAEYRFTRVTSTRVRISMGSSMGLGLWLPIISSTAANGGWEPYMGMGLPKPLIQDTKGLLISFSSMEKESSTLEMEMYTRAHM